MTVRAQCGALQLSVAYLLLFRKDARPPGTKAVVPAPWAPGADEFECKSFRHPIAFGSEYKNEIITTPPGGVCQEEEASVYFALVLQHSIRHLPPWRTPDACDVSDSLIVMYCRDMYCHINGRVALMLSYKGG